MVRLMKCFGLALAMCLAAAQLATAATIAVKVGSPATEKADAGKPIVAVLSLGWTDPRKAARERSCRCWRRSPGPRSRTCWSG